MPSILSPIAYEGATYLSFDPGDITGAVQWDEHGTPIAYHQLDESQLDEFLDLVETWPTKPRTIILEEYRVYGAVNHTGSKVHTIQVIGTLKRTARRIKCDVVEVRADSKRIAAMWSGTKIPRGHMPHWMAAYLVGYWDLHRKGIIRARVLDDND